MPNLPTIEKVLTFSKSAAILGVGDSWYGARPVAKEQNTIKVTLFFSAI
jgi:hypothetical protein